jgi:hypothetical protein
MLKTFTVLIGLSLIALTATAATAAPTGKLLWKSPWTTGVVYRDGTPVENCHATIRLVTDRDGTKHRVKNDNECLTPGIHNYISLSFPADGPPINMTDPKTKQVIKEATHFRVLPNGTIQLY